MNQMKKLNRGGLRIVLSALLLSGCAHAPADDPRDPLEPVNRAVFKFNDAADRYVMHPLAKGYVAVTPQPVRTGITNFFDNLGSPVTIVNDFLQLKFKQGASDMGRLVLNSTAGVAGFIDVASSAGMPKHQEDFGQTLGHYGVGEGWFLMLPLFGPSDNRDFVGRVVDTPLHPEWWLPGRYDVEHYSATGVDLVNTRANLLDADKVLAQQLDKYLFIRTAFLQSRQSAVYDGNPPPEKEDYQIYDDSDKSDTPAPKPKDKSDTAPAAAPAPGDKPSGNSASADVPAGAGN